MTSTSTTIKSSVDMTWLEQYRHIMVIGLGMSGVGVVKMLTSYGFEVHVQDSRENPASLNEIEALPNVASIHLGSFDQNELLASDLLIVSPGVSLQTLEIQKAIFAGIEISGDVDIVARSSSVPIIAITGSNGKSTVTQLTGDICQSAGLNTFVGGNIGRSVMELLAPDEHYEVAVLELSSFQLDTTAHLNARSAVVLNLSPDHLDRYDDFQAYAQSKLSVYKGASHLILNRDDQWLQNVELLATKKTTQKVGYSSSTLQKIISFGLGKPEKKQDFGVVYDEYGDEYFMQGQQKICSTNITSLIGTHNHLNILAALAILTTFDVTIESIKAVLMDFQGLPHRMQKVRELDGVIWVNDSKATNVGATMSAIKGLKGSIVLIAGGQGKGAEFDELSPLLEKYVRRVYLFGEDALQLQATWKNNTDCQLVDCLQTAVNGASEFAKRGETVLLAPACASFDMFKSFVARGDHFTELVNAL